MEFGNSRTLTQEITNILSIDNYIMNNYEGKLGILLRRRPINSNFKLVSRTCFFLCFYLIFYNLMYIREMGEVEEQQITYGDTCEEKKDCLVKINLGEVKEKLYLFLELENFYQAHKKFAYSYSKTQLQGEKI